MHDRKAFAGVGQGLEHDIAILVALLQHEDRASAHAIERFRHGLAVLAQKIRHGVHIARDQCGRAALREPGRVGLFVHIAQPLRIIDHDRALGLRAVQDVGRINELHVERRVLAHQNDVVVAQSTRLRLAEFEPVLGIVGDLEGCRASEGNSIAEPELVLFGIPDLPAAALGGQEHRKRAVLGGLDALDGVHDDEKADVVGHAESYGNCRCDPGAWIGSQSNASSSADRFLRKTVNCASVVSLCMARNARALPWPSAHGYVKKATRFRHLHNTGQNDSQRQK